MVDKWLLDRNWNGGVIGYPDPAMTKACTGITDPLTDRRPRWCVDRHLRGQPYT